jgi:hypothetical protein
VGSSGTMLEVYWVSTVEVGIRRDTVGISTPECAVDIEGKFEGLGVLAESVDVGIVAQIRRNLYVLLLVDKGRASGVEKLLAGGSARNRERKGLFFDVEDKIGGLRVHTRCGGPRNSELWNFVSLIIRIRDLDVKALLC